MTAIKAFVFDLDGVIVDTARFHYAAWRRLANELGFDLSEAENEWLKGVSRMESLEIVLRIGKIQAGDQEKLEFADKKNRWYKEFLDTLGQQDILPGAGDFLAACKVAGLKTSLASASKNAGFILEKLRIEGYFDARVDGNRTSRAKPDPEVFVLAARDLGVGNESCVVFEDSAAGIQAARNCGMYSVGIGSPSQLPDADIVLRGLAGLAPAAVIAQMGLIHSP